jgi:hypothetical protein
MGKLTIHLPGKPDLRPRSLTLDQQVIVVDFMALEREVLATLLNYATPAECDVIETHRPRLVEAARNLNTRLANWQGLARVVVTAEDAAEAGLAIDCKSARPNPVR